MAPDITAVHTPRLALRRFTPADLPWIQRLQADPEVMRYVGGVHDAAASEHFLQTRVLDDYTRHPGLGVWATLERSSGALVGMHLLNHMFGESHIQVGYVLAAEFWGRGYASEMCGAVLRYGFTTLGLPRIVAITDLDNHGSQRVLLKCGLRRHGERAFAHPKYASGPYAWYYRDADEWLADADHPSTSPST